MIFLKTMCFSQNISINSNQDTIVSISSDQLKYSNIIFLEHQKLSLENSLLNKQICNYKKKISILEENDSLRIKQLDNYKFLIEEYSIKIESLIKEIKDKNNTIKIIKIGGITITWGLLFLFLVK